MLDYRRTGSRLRSRWRGASRTLAVGVLAVAGLAGAPAPSGAAEYRLGPQDKLRIVVAEWRPSRGEAIAWTPLNGEFVVGSGGTLVLPLVGVVKAEALTLEELGEAISAQLQAKLGLVGRPSTSVEVAQFRPFYITGDVANPGEFPFRPGLTVLKAVSLAGGVYRPLGASAAGFERDSIVARGDLRMLAAEQTALRAKRTRLEAEATDKPGIDFPPSLTGSGADRDAVAAVREERLIFEARRSALNARIVSFNQAKVLLENEIATLNEKDANLDKQLRLAMAERDNVKSLLGKGLVVTSRQLTTEQNVAQMESARLDVGIARVRAEQDRGRIDRDVIGLRDQRRAEILAELRLTEGRLNEIRERLVTSERLAFNSEVTAPESEAEAGRERNLPPAFSIVRSEAGETREMDAGFATPLEPGDVVQVRRPRSRPAGGPATASSSGPSSGPPGSAQARAADGSVASAGRPSRLP